MIFSASGVDLGSGEKDNLFSMILALSGLLLVIYGLLKFIKIIWDNIPK